MSIPRRLKSATTIALSLAVVAAFVAAAVTVSSGATPAAPHGGAAGTSGAGSGTTGSTSGAVTSGRSGVTSWAGTPITPTAIPLGDGKVSSTPKVGYEDSCRTSFSTRGGAVASVPWIDTATGTWNLDKKLQVEGHNTWSTASHSFTLEGSSRVLHTNDLPVNATTGNFPISPSTPAYQYDRNPNSVKSQTLTWTVPADPKAAATPTCTNMGPIGVALNGVVLFNALDAGGRDAGAHEVQDSCDGHPQSTDMYHYHDFSSCLETAASQKPGSSTLVGYALDGYGIYAERDAAGNLPTDANLDACHGRTSMITWNGKMVDMYHYDVTLEFPYFVGCFHGTPVNGAETRTGGGTGNGAGGRHGAAGSRATAGGTGTGSRATAGGLPGRGAGRAGRGPGRPGPGGGPATLPPANRTRTSRAVTTAATARARPPGTLRR